MPEDGRRLSIIQPGTAATASPIFDRIAIVGLGLIGGSIALAAREQWPGGLVIDATTTASRPLHRIRP